MSTESSGQSVAERYDVVLLLEQQLAPADARLVRSLHEELDEEMGDRVVYHVLLPMADAAASVEASLGALGGADMLTAPVTPSADDLAAMRAEHKERADRELATTVAELEATGAEIGSASVITEPPVSALADKVTAVAAGEAIILTRPHLVSEFFHVDWTSRARRKLGVPVLHLLEHEQEDDS
jgi:hypothetical protein